MYNNESALQRAMSPVCKPQIIISISDVFGDTAIQRFEFKII